MNISYYYSLMSPWAYLGSERFYRLKEKYNFSIVHYPLDIINLFSLSGGEPLSKRAEQRKVYRMMELRRWKEVLNIPINFNPKYFPPSDLIKASCMILALDNEEDQNKLAYKLLEFVWKYEKDIGNDDNLKEACVQCSLDSDKLIISQENFLEKYQSHAQLAAQRNVFGSPSYVLDDGEIFWGQDRLDLLERALQKNKKKIE